MTETDADHRLADLLRDALHEHTPGVWRAVLVPIHFGLDGTLPPADFDAALRRWQAAGRIAAVDIAAGEPHDDDDVYYITLTDAGRLALEG